jgi:hypothetical protein
MISLFVWSHILKFVYIIVLLHRFSFHHFYMNLCINAHINILLAVPWLRLLVAGLLPRRSGFTPGTVHVRFLVHEVALGRGLLRAVRFPLSVSFHRGCQYSYTIWGINSRPVCGCSSETQSHPIGMNMNMNTPYVYADSEALSRRYSQRERFWPLKCLNWNLGASHLPEVC